MSHAAPARPWEKVGVDICTIRQQDYLITVDYLSGYIEVDRLPSKRVSDVIYCLKVQFARHGLPLEVVSDNNPFNAAEFRHFAAAYDFKHTTSSPHYPQSNGRAEAAVKTIKSLFEKAMTDREDPHLALLA
jgi:transposase InsO family protein